MDVAQIVHHAAQAGDGTPSRPTGQRRRGSAAAGAHREAVAHYRLVLEHASRFSPAERAALLEEFGVECYTLGAADAAVGARSRRSS